MRVALLARDLRLAHLIRTADAIQVATAIVAGVPVFHTYDAKLLKKDGKCGGKPPLRITEPRHPEADKQPLFEQKKSVTVKKDDEWGEVRLPLGFSMLS